MLDGEVVLQVGQGDVVDLVGLDLLRVVLDGGRGHDVGGGGHEVEVGHNHHCHIGGRDGRVRGAHQFDSNLK